MSSLGAKVKDILHGGDSQDTKREESDRRIPGSFPAEDMQPGGQERNTTLGREREHEHNKLHKPNDPRGWTEEDQASRGPGYKDSGAGFEEARGQSAFNDSHRSNLEQPRDTTTEPYERTTGRTEPYERSTERTEPYERSQRTEPYERTSERTEPYGITSERTPADRVDQPTTSNLPENKTNLSSQKEVLGSTVPTTQEHPYWGDLRPSGIPGSNDNHGSAVDKAKQYVQPSKTSPLVSGTFMKRREPTETSDTSNTQQTTQHVPDESKHDSHRKEAIGGAAVAGAGAYELNKKHRDDERLGQTDPASTSSNQPEEHKGRSFPLLGRGHKDKDVDHPKETKEDKHAHHPKEVKEDKHAKEPKQEHESKLGALFRRGSKDEGNTKPVKEDKHAHQPKELKEDKYAREPKPEHDNKTAILAGRSHKDETAPHTKDVKEEKHAKEPKPEHESKLGALFHRNKEPKEEKHAKEPKPEHEKKSGGLFHRRGSKDQAVPETQDNLVEDKHHGSKAAPALAAAGAGGAATYLATRDRHDEHQPRDTTTTGRYQDSTAPRGTDQYNTLSQPSESKPYTGTTQHPAGGQHDFADTTQHSGSHHVPAGAAVAGGAATYLGTKDRHNDRQPRDISSTGGQYNPADTTQHSGSQHAPTTGSHLPIASQFSSTDRTHQPTGTQQTPAFTSQSSEPRQYTDTQHSTEHRHIPSGAVGAAGLAGAAGAGTYLATRDRDDDRQPRDTTTTGNQYNPADTTQYSTGSQHTPAVASQSSEPTRYTDTHQPRDTHHIPASAAGAAGLAGAGTYLATRDPYGDSHSREATTTGSQYNPADTTQYSTGSQHVPTTGTQHSGSGQYNPVSQDFASQHSGTGHHSNLGQTGNFSSQSTQPTDRSFHDSSARSYEPEASHSHRDAKLATGAAAGLGAGALASHEHEQQGRNNEYTNEGTSRQPQASQYESGQPRTAGATDFSDNTTAPAHGIAKNEPLSGSDNHSDLPVFTQNANKGKYNTLSSGTPSGVRHE